MAPLPLIILAAAAAAAAATSASPSAQAPAPIEGGDNDTALVYDYVLTHVNETFREPSGQLFFPYQVPAGPYSQLWDWDSVFLGVVSARDFGGARYFVGSMMNFLAKVNLTSGEVKGCLTPGGDSPTLFHAKPILIQGAYLAAKASGDFEQFAQYRGAMEALFVYWSSPQRVDASTGLHRWHDQLETGADNLVLSLCPSPYSPECWVEALDAYTLSSPDIELFLAREHLAFAKFVEAWASVDAEADISQHRRSASVIVDNVDTRMWVEIDATRGYYGAFNTSSQTLITNRVYQLAWPLWSGGTSNATLIARTVEQLLEEDMMSPFGIRSTSSGDPRYSNDNIINPYSEWRGPVWINVNAVLAHSLFTKGYTSEANKLAAAVVHTLAQDLRTTGSWHECYSSANGTGLAASGFLSWNTLGATLIRDVAAGVDPFSLS